MKKDTIDELFQNLKGEFDVHETPTGHQRRFMEKMESQQQTSAKAERNTWWKPLSIAASVAIIVALSFTFLKSGSPQADLASVSPEMAQTQSFFTTTINKEMNTLKSFDSPETEILVKDALKQMDILEKEYETLKKDLLTSGNDKRVIYAMVSNFQKRIDLLKQVIEKIESIKNLNTKNYETTI